MPAPQRAGQPGVRGDQAASCPSTRFLPSITCALEPGLLSTTMQRGFIASGSSHSPGRPAGRRRPAVWSRTCRAGTGSRSAPIAPTIPPTSSPPCAGSTPPRTSHRTSPAGDLRNGNCLAVANHRRPGMAGRSVCPGGHGRARTVRSRPAADPDGVDRAMRQGLFGGRGSRYRLPLVLSRQRPANHAARGASPRRGGAAPRHPSACCADRAFQTLFGKRRKISRVAMRDFMSSTGGIIFGTYRATAKVGYS